MTTTQGSREDFRMNNEESDFNYWQSRMRDDVQFAQYMTELYKKQQLDIQKRETTNRKVSHHPRQQTTQHLPQLMDYPVLASPIQQQHHHGQLRTTKTSTDHPDALTYNQASSTSRRPLDESGSSQKQSQRQIKKSRPHELTPSTVPPIPTASHPACQFGFPVHHLKHAVANKLQCFYIKIVDDAVLSQMPSVIKVELARCH